MRGLALRLATSIYATPAMCLYASRMVYPAGVLVIFRIRQLLSTVLNSVAANGPSYLNFCKIDRLSLTSPQLLTEVILCLRQTKHFTSRIWANFSRRTLGSSLIYRQRNASDSKNHSTMDTRNFRTRHFGREYYGECRCSSAWWALS